VHYYFDNPAVIFSWATALALCLLAGWCRRLAEFAGRGAFIGVLLSAALWSLGAAAGTGEIVMALTWVPILCTPAFWLIFAWKYVKGEVRPVPKSWLVPHCVMLAVTLGLALTDHFHHLLHDAVGAVHGAWFFVVATYIYLLMLLSVAVMFDAVQRSKGLYRRQYAAITLAMALPWLANVAGFCGVLRPFLDDPTPFGFFLMGFVILRLIADRQLVNLLPIARSILVDAIPDPVLVLDRSWIVLDANAAAFALVGVAQALIGLRLGDVSILSPISRGLDSGEGLPSDLSVGMPERQFEVTMLPLDHAGRQVGSLLMLRDITRRARLESRLREQATRDTLTGLHNRRLLEEIGARLIEEARRQDQCLAVIMLDLDHFKRLNDDYGHRAGDQVLRAIGGFLLERVRQSDFVFRTGGEEILILLPGVMDAQALERIEGWRREFTALEIPIGSEGRVQISFSAGIALYPHHGGDLDEVLQYADKALYRAKNQGRNCSCLWPESGMTGLTRPQLGPI
jgi:diguanylate cyclase (GGDEF)-like protein